MSRPCRWRSGVVPDLPEQTLTARSRRAGSRDTQNMAAYDRDNAIYNQQMDAWVASQRSLPQTQEELKQKRYATQKQQEDDQQRAQFGNLPPQAHEYLAQGKKDAMSAVSALEGVRNAKEVVNAGTLGHAPMRPPSRFIIRCGPRRRQGRGLHRSSAVRHLRDRAGAGGGAGNQVLLVVRRFPTRTAAKAWRWLVPTFRWTRRRRGACWRLAQEKRHCKNLVEHRGDLDEHAGKPAAAAAADVRCPLIP